MLSMLSIVVVLLLSIVYGNSFRNHCNNNDIPYRTSSSSSSSSPPSSSSSSPSSSSSINDYDCISYDEEYVHSMKYLSNNIPSFDIINKVSLGFSNNDNIILPDGLNNGLVNIGLNISLNIKTQYQWAADLSHDLWYEYVLPYGIVNEPRNNWRPLLANITKNILDNSGQDIDNLNITDVFYLINNGIWNMFNKPIVFISSQTPLIYDPMSTIVFGYSSCTGLSIFLVDALRSVGIAARLVGTPAWNNDINNGNHNWIEVYTGIDDGWQFIESVPAGGTSETFNNPCSMWFCNSNHMINGTKFYAAAFDQSRKVRYPMAWDLSNLAIPGIDRTDYYQDVCNKC